MAERVRAEDARNEALAAEHAAVWTYGVLAARTSRSRSPALLTLLNRNFKAHVRARDALLAALAEDGTEPAVASRARTCALKFRFSRVSSAGLRER
ncbi:MAG: DUF4439 domain-containing protein, partial [Nocardioides sp.]|uniref:DUF4439 domain-containing protein n=1 Tax=Nocardioides sp. TaxID=35761 RepID=UPI0039E2B634